MISKSELKEWIDNLPDDATIGVDDGGLTIQSSDGNWLELGGCPEGQAVIVRDAKPDCYWDGSKWSEDLGMASYDSFDEAVHDLDTAYAADPEQFALARVVSVPALTCAYCDLPISPGEVAESTPQGSMHGDCSVAHREESPDEY